MISYKSPAILLCAVLTLSMRADRDGYPTGAAAEPLAPAVAPDAAMDDLADGFDAFRVRHSSGSLRSVGSERAGPIKMYGKIPGTKLTGDEAMVDVADAIEMPAAVAAQSVLVKEMMEFMDEAPIPMLNVEQDILQKVVDYMTQHAPSNKGPAADIIKPLKSTNLIDCGVDDWDNAYIDVPQEELFKIILAANYMNIKPLLDLACAKVASMIKGKNVDEIRKQFNIANDFTPEEEKQIREENRWADGEAASSTPAP